MANYKNQISSILYHEGGLSKDTRDNASAYPVPDGSGYHTNKGVTWQTFVSLGQKLGYTPTPALFYKMPENIWLKIYKVGYWDAIKGDEIKSQAVADLVVQMAWGSGAYRAGTILQKTLRQSGYNVSVDGAIGSQTIAATNAATKSKNSERAFYDTLWKNRMSFLQSLSDWVHYKNGWTRRMNDVYKAGMASIGKTGVITATTLGLFGFTILAYRHIKSKKDE